MKRHSNNPSKNLLKCRVPVKDIKCIGFSSTAGNLRVFWMKIINLYVKSDCMDGYKGNEGSKELTEQFENKISLRKSDLMEYMRIHPVSKILAVKHKTPEIFEKTRMFAQIKDYFI